MKPWVRVTAAALAVGLTVPVLSLGVAASASAASFDDIIDLFNYKLLKSGTELQAAMGPAAAAAWGPETARLATRSASAYNIAAATSGIAEVVPDAIYLRPQDLPQIKPPAGALKTWSTKYTGVGLNKPLGVAGAAIAMTGFQYRAEIADGVTSWLGFDAATAVCSDPTASGGFINFITGQDCNAWRLAAEYTPNTDVIPVPDGYTSNIYEYKYPDNAARRHIVLYGPVTVDGPQLSYTVTLLKKGQSDLGTSDDRIYMRCELPGGGGGEWKTQTREYWGSDSPGSTKDFVLTCSEGKVPQFFVDSVNGVWPSTLETEEKQKAGWGAPGTAHYLAGIPEDPERYFVCDYTGSDGQHYTAESDRFTEGSGSVVAPVCPGLPPGVTSTHMKITLVGGGQSSVVADLDALGDPLGDGSDTNGVTTAYCGTNLCVLELMDLRTNKSCFDEGDACDGWLQSPTRDADYKCFYGGVEQDFKQCYVYAQVFNTAKRLAGEPYADPKTGDDTGTKSGLSIDELTMANEPRPAAFGRNCFGGDWGASNPVNWVLRPIQCALEWAFAARPEVLTANAEVVQSAWQNTAPGEVVTAVGAWGFPAGSTGCAGPAVNIPFFGLTGHPLSACEGTMLASLAGPVKTIISVLLVFGGGFVIVRLVAGVIGYRGIDE